MFIPSEKQVEERLIRQNKDSITSWMNIMIRRIHSVFLILLLIITCAGCGFKKDHYDLVVYPNKGDLTQHIFVGRFDTADAARVVAAQHMLKYPNGDYEIGKNKKDSLGDIGVYEETFR